MDAEDFELEYLRPTPFPRTDDNYQEILGWAMRNIDTFPLPISNARDGPPRPRFNPIRAIENLEQYPGVPALTNRKHGAWFLRCSWIDNLPNGHLVFETQSKFYKGKNFTTSSVLVHVRLDMNDPNQIRWVEGTIWRCWHDSQGIWKSKSMVFAHGQELPVSPDPAINAENAALIWETMRDFRDKVTRDYWNPLASYGRWDHKLHQIPKNNKVRRIMSSRRRSSTPWIDANSQFDLMALPPEVITMIVDEAVLDSISTWNRSMNRVPDWRGRFCTRGPRGLRRVAAVHTVFCLNKFFRDAAQNRFWKVARDFGPSRSCETLLAYKHIFGIDKTEEQIVGDLETREPESGWRRVLPEVDRWDYFNNIGAARCNCGTPEKRLVDFPMRFRRDTGTSS